MSAEFGLESFLDKWLAARMQDAAVARYASALHKMLSALVQPVNATMFPTLLCKRISGVKDLLAQIDADKGGPAAPASIRGQWLRAAREIADRWKESEWVNAALELTAQKNPILVGAVSQSLDDFLTAGHAHRDAIEPIKQLKALDGRAFPRVPPIPLPPAAKAPWDASEYLFPNADRAIFDMVADRLDRSTRSGPADFATCEAVKDLCELLAQSEEGWPIQRSRLQQVCQRVLAPIAGNAELNSGLFDALNGAKGGTQQPAPATKQPGTVGSSSDDVLRRARESLATLARELLSQPIPAAQAFGSRVSALVALPECSTARGLHQELVGCLAFLDEGDGNVRVDRWRKSTLDRVARIAEHLGGGEVLAERLLGQPLGRWTDSVSFIGYDENAPPGEPRRITQVERPGYVLVFSDGGRKTLVRAQVRIAP